MRQLPLASRPTLTGRLQTPRSEEPPDLASSTPGSPIQPSPSLLDLASDPAQLGGLRARAAGLPGRSLLGTRVMVGAPPDLQKSKLFLGVRGAQLETQRLLVSPSLPEPWSQAGGHRCRGTNRHRPLLTGRTGHRALGGAGLPSPQQIPFLCPDCSSPHWATQLQVAPVLGHGPGSSLSSVLIGPSPRGPPHPTRRPLLTLRLCEDPDAAGLHDQEPLLGLPRDCFWSGLHQGPAGRGKQEPQVGRCVTMCSEQAPLPGPHFPRSTRRLAVAWGSQGHLSSWPPGLPPGPRGASELSSPHSFILPWVLPSSLLCGGL